MYRGIAHLSKKTAGRIGKENWENKLFLTFSSIVWFWIGGFAAALCCAAAEFVLTKTISGTFFESVLLIAAAFAVFAGFYGGILYLMRRGTFPKRRCVVQDAPYMILSAAAKNSHSRSFVKRGSPKERECHMSAPRQLDDSLCTCNSPHIS